jgi:putative hydroxymethylpyrimidine transport system substrate-binding protein
VRVGALVLALAAGLALTGCGGSGSSPTTGAGGSGRAREALSPEHPQHATLILDFTPNAVHAGIYRALAAGYYHQEGIDLKVVTPSATSDTLKLIDAGSAQFGLADGSDLAGLIAKGGDARAVMAIVQRPLGGLIAKASEHLSSPALLQGKAVGITGVPSDRAVLDTEVRHAGGDPSKVHVVTIGFDGGQALEAGKIAAFTGFIPDDGVALQVSGTPITAFALDANGGPSYPGLVAFTTRREIATDPRLVRGFVAATVHGYEDTLANPRRSLGELLEANPSLQEKETWASLRAYLPLFEGSASGAVRFGKLQAKDIRALSKWMLANHLIDRRVTVGRYGTNRFLAGTR